MTVIYRSESLLEQLGDSASVRQARAGASATALVPAVLKAVAVVRRLNEVGMAGATLGEMAIDLGITRSHCHAILLTLIHSGWASYDTASRLYRLHWQISIDTASTLRAQDELAQVYPLASLLSRQVRLPCLVSQPLPDGSFVVLRQIDGPNPLEVSIKRGERFPRDAPAQMKAALAWADPQRLELWLKDWKPEQYTPSTITTPGRLAHELKLTRERGYATSAGEFNVGVDSVALPVFDADGNILVILQCHGFTADVGPRLAEIGRQMQLTVAQIHDMIGGAPPAAFGLPAWATIDIGTTALTSAPDSDAEVERTEVAASQTSKRR